MESQIIWTIILIISLAVEALTLNLVTIWIALGALVALISSIFVSSVMIQTVIFIITTLLTLIFTRSFIKDILKVKSVKTNLDSVVGQIGIVTSDISEDKRGKVKIAGKIWTAISDSPISVGEKVEILAIEGVKLVVKRRDE